MIVNLKKTRVSIFNKDNSKSSQYRSWYNGDEMKIISHYKYDIIYIFSNSKNMSQSSHERQLYFDCMP